MLHTGRNRRDNKCIGTPGVRGVDVICYYRVKTKEDKIYHLCFQLGSLYILIHEAACDVQQHKVVGHVIGSEVK